MRTITWDEQKAVVKLIDQSVLPMKFQFVELTTHDDVYHAIKNMVVRGAPAIGVAAIYGMALAAREYKGQASTLKALLAPQENTISPGQQR